MLIKGYKLARPILNVLAPDSCIVCGDLSELVCDKCLSGIHYKKPESCYRCNRLSVDFKTCNTCRKHSSLARVVVASNYQDYVQNLIYSLKYANSISAATPLARLIYSMYADDSLSTKYDLLIPAPTSASNIRRRGYCQAEIITAELAKLTGIKTANVLYKLGKTSQVGSDRSTRISQVRDSIYTMKSSERIDIKDKRILLVDDVVTTGATLNECAKVLKSIGVAKIEAAVVAKN
ncbi:MAG: phosphoribosyltransferase family protein [Candidatus Saccharimonadales bacterium]